MAPTVITAGRAPGTWRARAALVARRGHDQNAQLGALPNRIRQQWMRFPRCRRLSTANVDNVRACISRLLDGAGEVQLRARRGSTVFAIVENRHNQPTAARSDAEDRTRVLSENYTGDVRTVATGRSGTDTGRRQCPQLGQHRAGKTRMGKSLGPKFAYAWNG